jgi:hypothetical protein
VTDWRFSTAPSVGESLTDAIVRARAQQWTRKDAGDSKPIDDFRALVAATALEASRLAGDTTISGTELRASPVDQLAGPNLERAKVLLRTWDIVAQNALPALPSPLPASFETSPDNHLAAPIPASSPPGGNSSPALGVLAIYVGGAVLAVAVCAYFAAPVVDSYLSRSQAAAVLVKSHADAIAMADQHAAAEEKAGTPLPWTPQQQAAFDALIEAQKKAATGATTPPASPPGSWNLLDSLTIGAVGVAALGVFLVFRK